MPKGGHLPSRTTSGLQSQYRTESVVKCTCTFENAFVSFQSIPVSRAVIKKLRLYTLYVPYIGICMKNNTSTCMLLLVGVHVLQLCLQD